MLLLLLFLSLFLLFLFLWSINVVLKVSVEFVWWGGGEVGYGVVGWGLQSHFHVQPNYSVEVVLCCVVVGVATITSPFKCKKCAS